MPWEGSIQKDAYHPADACPELSEAQRALLLNIALEGPVDVYGAHKRLGKRHSTTDAAMKRLVEMELVQEVGREKSKRGASDAEKIIYSLTMLGFCVAILLIDDENRWIPAWTVRTIEEEKAMYKNDLQLLSKVVRHHASLHPKLLGGICEVVGQEVEYSRKERTKAWVLLTALINPAEYTYRSKFWPEHENLFEERFFEKLLGSCEWPHFRDDIAVIKESDVLWDLFQDYAKRERSRLEGKLEGLNCILKGAE